MQTSVNLWYTYIAYIIIRLICLHEVVQAILTLILSALKFNDCTSIPRLEIGMLTQRLLQPVWELILSKCGALVSYWLFPVMLQSTVYMGTALYFLRSHKGHWSTEI